MQMMSTSDSVATAGVAGWAWKVGSIILGWLASLIAPVQPFLVTIAVLVLIDMVTGIWAANKRGEAFSSNRLARTVPKIVLYPVGILLSELMVSTYFNGTPVVSSLTYMVALFLSAVEFQSNIENIGHITGTNLWSHIKGVVLERILHKSKKHD